MKNVTQQQLAEILLAKKAQKGAAIFASILQYTSARLKKTNNPYADTMKLTSLSVILNTEYETGVINQLKKEDKEPEAYQKGENTMPLTFGENNRFIGTFKDNYVLQYRPFDNSHPKVKYLHNGKLISKDTIRDFLPSESKAENQGTQKEILWRKVYLSNVKKIKIDKEVYRVIS